MKLENKTSRQKTTFLYKIFFLFLIVWGFAMCTPSTNSQGIKNKAEMNVADALADINVVMRGMSVYNSKCADCHGTNGEGGVGPNLTDSHWIHGNHYEDIVDITNYGMVDKGKMAFKGILSEQAISDVAIYVMTLEGSPIENGKASEGKEYPPAYTYYQEPREDTASESENDDSDSFYSPHLKV